jgi:3-oxoisoapionate decarboxylase
MKLGLSSYTFGWSVGVEGFPPSTPCSAMELLERTSRSGLTVLQIADNLPSSELNQDSVAALASRASQLGIDIELGMRGLFVERIARYADIARSLASSMLRIVIDDEGYAPTVDRVIAILKESVHCLQGVRLAIENHDRFPAATLRQIIESVASDRVRICLDTANSLGAGEGLETVLRELGRYTVNLHIKDFSIQRVPTKMGFAVEGRPAGSGMLDIPSLLRAFEAYPDCKTAILELWTPAERTLDETIAKEDQWAQMSIQYLQPLFSRHVP